jgi:hypothetical protein
MTIDHETSISVARRIRARFRRCWHNAARAVHHLGEGAQYVEGWVVVNRVSPLVIEHGWCEASQRIVDPTYTPYVSTLEPPLAYFAGLRYRPAETHVPLQQRTLPIALQRQDDAAYRQAFEAAWRRAHEHLLSEPSLPTRVVNCRHEPCDVFVGRPSHWGNPFHIGRDGTRQQIVDKYREWLIRQPALLREVPHLRGKTLGCDCAPAPCHGDVLAQLANITIQSEQAA